MHRAQFVMISRLAASLIERLKKIKGRQLIVLQPQPGKARFGFALLLSSALNFSQRRTLFLRNSRIDYSGFWKIRCRRLICLPLNGIDLLL